MVTKSELQIENARLLSEVDRLTADLESAKSTVPKHSPAKLAEARIAELNARVDLLEREVKAKPPTEISRHVDP